MVAVRKHLSRLPAARPRATLPVVNQGVPRLLRLLLCALLLVVTGTPAWAHCQSETRVGGSADFLPNFTTADDAKPIAASGENDGCGYDFASGLHKYLYAQDDPVDHVDPSGHDIGDLLAVADIFTSFSAMILPVTSVATVLGTGQSTRPLTSGEISLAQTIYGGNIDYTKSGVNYGKFIFFQPKGREMTPNGVIYTGGVTIADYSVAGSRPAQYKDPKIEFGDQKAVFIHEMCHVWQYQHGKDVELRAALYRNYAYADVNFGTKSFDTYGMEQEAEMVQDYYYLTLDPPLHNWSMPDPVPPKSTYEKVIPFLPKK